MKTVTRSHSYFFLLAEAIAECKGNFQSQAITIHAPAPVIWHQSHIEVWIADVYVGNIK